jgi:repressor LexA
MIKKAQKAVFDYIKEFSACHGYAPTLQEIQEKFGFKSISTAHYHVKKLQDAGYLEKVEGRSRSIQAKNVTFGGLLLKTMPEYFSLPVLGSANCGPANIFAVEDPREYVQVSATTLGRRSKDGLFVLEADGESMNLAKIGAKRLSIESGDYVVIDSTVSAPSDGDYVLSVIDGCANIKKFKKIDGKMALVSESTSTKFKPIFLGSADDFVVNGKVIDVLKYTKG